MNLKPFVPISTFPMSNVPSPDTWHGTTILSVRKGGVVVVAGDGQVPRPDHRQGRRQAARRLGKDDVIAGFAGATADAFALFDRLESKLEPFPDNLTRACVELAKDWRTDRYLRRLEAMMLVADTDRPWSFQDRRCAEPEDGVIGIGSATPMRLPRLARSFPPISTPRQLPERHEDRRRHLRLHQ